MMPSVLISIYRLQAETDSFRKIEAAFRRRGWKLVLWTNWNKGDPGVPSLPLVASAKEASWYCTPKGAAVEANAHWQEFNAKLKSAYGYVDTAYDVERCISSSNQVFDAVQPDLFICWCGMNPLFSIPLEIARSCGIPTLVWEAGLLSNTFLLDRGGVCCDAEQAGVPLTADFTESELEAADRLLAGMRQKLTEQGYRGKLAYPPKNGLPRILVLGGMDSANGVYRPEGAARSTLGALGSGVDLANAVARAFPWASILYRPHPREPNKPLLRLDKQSVTVDGVSPITAHYVWADIIVGYGSKTDMDVLAMGKPLVVAGSTVFSGKGLGFEGHYAESLGQAIQDALQYGMTDAQRHNVRRFFAYQQQEACYARNDTAACRKGLDDFVTDALRLAGVENCEARSTRAHLAALSDAGREKLAHLQMEAEVLRQGTCSRDVVLEKLKSGAVETVVLDFDHTLLKANSTELFLRLVRPGVCGFLAEFLADFAIVILRRLKIYEPVYRDYIRVWSALLLAPWSLLLWRLRAERLAKQLVDLELLKCAKANNRRTWIVSNGFRQLIEPIASYLPTVDNLVTANIFRPSEDVRRSGKLKKIDAHGLLERASTLSVSDSVEDADLLTSTHGCWLTPQTSKMPNPVYSPFRYLADGKYSRRWFINRVLGHDLLVVLLVFAHSPLSTLALIFLFVSLYSIYELGYYENDHEAAKNETEPTLAASAANFDNYSIGTHAWGWSLATGLVGVTLISGFTPFSIMSWIVVLILLRLIYYVYNRISPLIRGYLYPLLQAFKFLGYAAVCVPTLIGLPLILGQASWQVINYWIYRSGGDKRKMNPFFIRFSVFLVGMIALGSFLSLIDTESLFRGILIFVFVSAPLLPFFPRVVQVIKRD